MRAAWRRASALAPALSPLLSATVAAALATSCTTRGALDPAGIQAQRLAGLYWWFFWISVGVYLVVAVLALVPPLVRRRRLALAPASPAEPLAGAPVLAREPERERRLVRVVTAGGLITAAIMVVLLVVSVHSGDAVASAGLTKEPLDVEIVGHQWWWEITYPNTDQPWRAATTANELHVPVGRMVRLKLQSNDVIHSFWVPRLHGKMDLIPGRTTWHWIRADRAGHFVGQCAEFCGLQHAHMGLVVVADPPAAFDAWLDGQRLPAAAPATAAQLRGKQVFEHSSCVLCHSVRGTVAGARNAPDLTHLASRGTIAAATLPNSNGHLTSWVRDPQNVKPGNAMPANPLRPDDLQALVAYLGSLR